MRHAKPSSTSTILGPVLVMLGLTAPAAWAAPLTPTYTVNDLGPGTISYGTNAQGGGTITASDGQVVYAFQKTNNVSLSPSQATLVPLVQAAPVSMSTISGGPNSSYAVLESAIQNASGTVAAIESSGVTGHQSSGTAFFVQPNASGGWGQPTAMWSGNPQFSGGPSSAGLSIIGINAQNQVLGTMGADPAHGVATNAVLYDINSRSTINLSNYLTTLGPNLPYHDVAPLAIDDQGRILLRAGYGLDAVDHTVLLTPAGVSSGPLEVAAPEPASLTIMALVLLAGAARLAHERRARS